MIPEKAGKDALQMVGKTVIVSIQKGLECETIIEIAGKGKIIGGMAIFGATL